jgi:hypothetical protein
VAGAPLLVGFLAMRLGAQPPVVHPDTAVGRAVFEAMCTSCHSLEPPPKAAPPMRMVVMHLKQRFSTREAFVAHVVRWVPAPDSTRSALPAMARQRFGLMPAQPIGGDALEQVAAWLWALPAGGMGGEGAGGHGGHRGHGPPGAP